MSALNMRVFKQVPRILFGEGTLERLHELLPKKDSSDYYVYIVDSVHKKTGVLSRLKPNESDKLILVDTHDEPSTDLVDELRDKILAEGSGKLPKAVVGVGGGAAMDIAKGIAVMLKNEGSARKYQGWDLVVNPAVFKVGIPTLSGSGSEASRTAVFFSDDKKFGINSDHSMFDAILLDSSLIKGVPDDQRFYTGMDCYIHCVESIQGTMINELARAHASHALDLCREVFLGNGTDDQMMVASYMGGCSIVNSEVGVCHALSYGLSLELDFHHGVANCIAFDVLDDYYGDYVKEFRQMVKKLGVKIPKDVTRGISEDKLERMVAMTLKMERPLTNALGPQWRDVFTKDKITALYKRM